MSIKVRATQTGFHAGVRRREGDVFTLAEGSKPSAKWMEVLEGGDAESKKVKGKGKTDKVEQAAVAAEAQAHDATNSAKTNGPVDKLDGIEGNAAEQKGGGDLV